MDKLTLKFDVFEGPLDLLLHLISKNKVNIYDIPVSSVLEQYMDYLGALTENNLDIASEFLTMAAQLIYIKTKMLLPKPETEEDPRMPLVETLLEYQKYKQAAATLAELYDTNLWRVVKAPEEIELDNRYKGRHQISELVNAYAAVLRRAHYRLPPPPETFAPIVASKVESVGAKIVNILRRLVKQGVVSFSAVIESVRTRSEIVAAFLAVLELCKSKRVVVRENGSRDYKIYLNGR